MVQVNFVVHGNVTEAGTRCSVQADGPLTSSGIKRIFPYEGLFHFRLNIKESGDGEYIWLDLNDSEENIVTSGSTLEVQALVLSLPDNYIQKNEYVEYSPQSNLLSQPLVLALVQPTELTQRRRNLISLIHF